MDEDHGSRRQSWSSRQLPPLRAPEVRRLREATDARAKPQPAQEIYSCNWHKERGEAVCANSFGRPVEQVDEPSSIGSRPRSYKSACKTGAKRDWGGRARGAKEIGFGSQLATAKVPLRPIQR